MYGTNRKATQPCQVTLTGVAPVMASAVRRLSGFDTWLAMKTESRCYTEVFKRGEHGNLTPYETLSGDGPRAHQIQCLSANNHASTEAIPRHTLRRSQWCVELLCYRSRSDKKISSERLLAVQPFSSESPLSKGKFPRHLNVQ